MNTLKRLLPAFLITLIVVAGCKSEKYNFEDLPPTVKSFYTITYTDLHINQEIQFHNESEDAESYTWDFGDGTKSTEKNVTKTYTEPGTYTVKLTAVGPGGTGNYSIDLAIIDPDAVVESDKELYFIEYNSPPRAIRKISLTSGSLAENVVSLSGKVGVGMTYDEINKKIYYCDFQNSDDGKIWRMDADGSNMQEIISGLIDPYGVTINHAEGRIYIVDDAYISRAYLDGSGYEREFIKIDGGDLRGVAYSTKVNRIYFIDYEAENLYVAKTDGTGVEKLIPNVFGNYLFVDDVNEKMYFEDRSGGKRSIMMANLDGSQVEKFADVPGTQVFGIAIDYSTNKLYWTERDNGLIKRANLDGSAAETVLSGLSSPRGIFIKDK